MKLHGAEIVDTFAEAFPMWGARVVITAATPAWALEAGRSMTGFATSVIGCKCEAGIGRELGGEGDTAGRAAGRERAAVRHGPRGRRQAAGRANRAMRADLADGGLLQRAPGRGHG